MLGNLKAKKRKKGFDNKLNSRVGKVFTLKTLKDNVKEEAKMRKCS